MFLHQLVDTRSRRAAYLLGRPRGEAIVVDATPVTRGQVDALLAGHGARLVAQLRTRLATTSHAVACFSALLGDLGIEPSDQLDDTPFPGVPDHGPVRPWANAEVLFDGPEGLRELDHHAVDAFDGAHGKLGVAYHAARMRLAGLAIEVLPTGRRGEVAYRIGGHLFTGGTLHSDAAADRDQATGTALFTLSADTRVHPGCVGDRRSATLLEERRAFRRQSDSLVPRQVRVARAHNDPDGCV